jgi:predicted nucleic acid-binding protein
MADSAVADTVILRYFLFVHRADLMLELLGTPLYVPRIVFDPEEGVPDREEAMSEITRSILVQRRTAADVGRSPRDREEAGRKAVGLEEIHALHSSGSIEIVDLTDEEFVSFARLTSSKGAREVGLTFRLQPGEAACVAVAVSRGWVLATDDQDALKALEHLSTGHAYQRIRRLLRQGADDGVLSREDANTIHTEMTRLGFRDDELPFSEVS